MKFLRKDFLFNPKKFDLKSSIRTALQEYNNNEHTVIK